MAWWKIADDPELITGDDPIIFGGRYLEDLATEYLSEFGRKPKLAEFIAGLELLLEGDTQNYFSDTEAINIKQVTVKTEQQKRKQPFDKGDFFSIPLKDGLYGYGRIFDKKATPVIDIFDFVDKAPCFLSAIHESDILFRANMLKEGLDNWHLRIMGVPLSTKNKEVSIKIEITDEQYYPWERVAWRIEAEKKLVQTDDVRQMLTEGRQLMGTKKYKEASTGFGKAYQYLKWITEKESERKRLQKKALDLLNECMDHLGY